MTADRADADPDGSAVDRLVAELRRDEKLRLVSGGVDPTGTATGYVPPVDRVGVPACSFTDGPMGVRAGTATAFPASIALAASWDPALAEAFGAALASEARAKGCDGVLAPGLNLIRVPQCGRNFEYYSEDPRLTAGVAAGTVAGVESMDVLAVPKHYLANNQETDRLSVSAEIGERAFRELYLPGVAAAIERGGAGVVMAAYNRVNGAHAAENRWLLTDILKGELAFDGVMMSDWWGVVDGTAAAAAGLDLEMPGVALADLLRDGSGGIVGPRELARRWPPWLPSDLDDVLTVLRGPATDGPALREMIRRSPFAASLPDALDGGALAERRLDDMVRRLLRQYERVGLLDPASDRPDGECATPAHRALAERVAIRGTVLLRNDGMLPLDAAETGRLAVVGPHADAARVGGGGSSEVTPERTVDPLAGVRRRAGPSVDVTFERGLWPGPRSPLSGLPFVDGGRRRARRRLFRAVRAARRADVALVIVEDDAAEGVDRETLALPAGQERLVRAVAATDTPTVVALATSGPVEAPWFDDVEAVVQTWYPGQEHGNALATVLFGDADPGGRLPVTFGRTAADYPANTPAQYPGVVGPEGYREANYSEGVFVGYRHFDAAGVEPLFPFGHGLSYAEFAYRDLAVEAGPTRGPPVAARATVENVGDRPGREVVQAYARVESGGDRDLPRPPRELAGFAAVALDPGEAATVRLALDERAFVAYDAVAGEWTLDADAVEVEVGRSSRDLRLAETVMIEGA